MLAVDTIGLVTDEFANTLCASIRGRLAVTASHHTWTFLTFQAQGNRRQTRDGVSTVSASILGQPIPDKLLQNVSTQHASHNGQFTKCFFGLNLNNIRSWVTTGRSSGHLTGPCRSWQLSCV